MESAVKKIVVAWLLVLVVVQRAAEAQREEVSAPNGVQRSEEIKPGSKNHESAIGNQKMGGRGIGNWPGWIHLKRNVPRFDVHRRTRMGTIVPHSNVGTTHRAADRVAASSSVFREPAVHFRVDAQIAATAGCLTLRSTEIA